MAESWLDRMVKRTADNAVQSFLHSQQFDRMMEDAVARAVANNPRIKFVKVMQMEMVRIDPAMDMRIAWNAARDALLNFLHDEKIEFGGPAHDWSNDGARTLIHEQEIDHWEAKP